MREKPTGLSRTDSAITPTSASDDPSQALLAQSREATRSLDMDADMGDIRGAIEAYFLKLDKYDNEDIDIVTERGVRTGREWHLQHTLAYWVACSFILGSILFSSGSAFWFEDFDELYLDALVDYPFFIGSLSFTFGSYAAFFEYININNHGAYYFCKGPDGSLGWWATFNFLLGALSYNVNTVAGIKGGSHGLAWGSAVLGSFFFVVASVFEMVRNKAHKWRPDHLSWWVSWCNFGGSVGFEMAAVDGLVGFSDGTFYKWSYLIGSLFFLLSGVLSLLMWKLEQFGNAYAPQLNIHKPANRSVQISQLPFLVMYNCIIAVAVSGFMFSLDCNPSMIKDYVLALLMPIGILVLGSEIHRVPEKAPYSYLLWFLRFSMLFFLVNLIINTDNVCPHHHRR